MDTLVVCAHCEALNRVPLERARQARPVCGQCKAALPFHDGVQEVSASGLARLIRASDQPVVVDFCADWCGPCKAFAPTYQAAAREFGGKVVFAKVDTEAHADAARDFQIQAIPTLMVFKAGSPVDRQSGAMPLPTFRRYLEQWL